MDTIRNLLFIVWLAPALCAGQANVYHPLPDSNAFWKETSFYLYPGPPPTPVYYEYTVFTEGDTVIGANTYTKIYETGVYSALGPMFFYAHVYRGAYRQNIPLKQVYYVAQGLLTESLMYDFNLNVGDTFSWNGYNEVLDIDSVPVSNSYHKRFLLNQLGWGGTGVADTNYALIEGVGSTLGFYQPIVVPFENGSQLQCFSSDTLTYPAWYSCLFFSGLADVAAAPPMTIYPNPATDVMRVAFADGPPRVPIELFNSYGVCLRVIEVSATGNGSYQQLIDLSGLANGVYLLKAGAASMRFIKL